MKFAENKGQLSILGIVGTVIGIVVIVAVGIPVTNSVIESANLTGTTATVVSLVPLFFGLGALIVVTGLFGGTR